MKSILKLLSVSCGATLLIACGAKSGQKVDSIDSTEVTKQEVTAEEQTETEKELSPEEEALLYMESEWDAIQKWEISITAFTSMATPISEAEAKEIEKNPDDEIWVEFDEEEGQWIKHGEAMVVVDTITITEPDKVKRLNDMMIDPAYSEYDRGVTFNGVTAKAKWYGGNRGGGIEEDFPEDVKEWLNM